MPSGAKEPAAATSAVAGLAARTAHYAHVALANLHLLARSERPHTTHVSSGPFFEGWYYKTTPANGGCVVIIPGTFRPTPAGASSAGHAARPSRSDPHAFIMVFRHPRASQCLYYAYPIDEFAVLDDGDESAGGNFGFRFRIGASVFAHDGFSLDLDPGFLCDSSPTEDAEFLATVMRERAHLYSRADDKETAAAVSAPPHAYPKIPYTVTGSVRFTDIVRLPTSWWAPSVMGPFRYLPAMECYHGVVSLHHNTYGSVTFTPPNDAQPEVVVVDGGEGYVERDHGFNFPRSWIWVQAHEYPTESGSTVMVSVADVPMLSDDWWLSALVRHALPFGWGRALLARGRIAGFLVVLYHARTGKTYNFSLYEAAVLEDLEFGTEPPAAAAAAATANDASDSAAVAANARVQTLRLVFTSGPARLTLRVRRPLGVGVPLFGPAFASGRMGLIVEESIVGVEVHTTLELAGRTVFDDVGGEAGIEVVGDLLALASRAGPWLPRIPAAAAWAASAAVVVATVAVGIYFWSV
ncbi:hypothetical protein HK405_010537 [Cladochytrium tenue]|nr:hypothetical protein HK405_010537 [Cladochytrium tenue]